jgi:hypothetical protein
MKHKITPSLLYILIGLIASLLMGIYIGMTIQQMVIIAGMVEFGESLAGTNINVTIDLNETELVKGFKDEMSFIYNEGKGVPFKE